MKARKVVVSLEILTDAKVTDLETIAWWDFGRATIFRIAEKPKVTVIVQPVKKK